MVNLSHPAHRLLRIAQCAVFAGQRYVIFWNFTTFANEIKQKIKYLWLKGTLWPAVPGL